jgi:hypothetical protein
MKQRLCCFFIVARKIQNVKKKKENGLLDKGRLCKFQFIALLKTFPLGGEGAPEGGG